MACQVKAKLRPHPTNSVGRTKQRDHLWLLLFSKAILVSLMVSACGTQATPVPTPQGGVSEVVSFTTDDGVELKGRIFGQGSTGVVLAHMFHADQSGWWDFAQALADSGYIALTFNFRGYGKGDSKSGGDKEIKLIDRDMAAALGFIRERGASTIFMIGASMGGTASLKVAAKQPVAGVVSLSAPVEFKGMNVGEDRVRVPVLLMATDGDRSAKNNVEGMIQDGIVAGPELTEAIVYEEGNDHGTNILTGANGSVAIQRILSFLEAHSS